ncbi:MAG: acyltransferase [Turicibacter sanguinis]|uniref:acyltransferase family protein n=1 Tax=Turicibacter TaxID=191303 RepID=UPI00164E0CA3|nr:MULTISPECIES: acyltransferase [Turicibacter]MBP3904024.1 acyltransferase [Turicibacter sp.]MDB8567250.1 acyltransferase [Turicibacter sanguinis]MDB8570000.1 acyltransferase [Turicibacter sanguinis]MDB8572751.1 acyltransferase [Turicibacter sanguinis]MDB8581482.1 acyltransferase [Turicibacter sanguinis]
MYDQTISKEKTVLLRCVAICLMLVHHLFAFPERNIRLEYTSLFFNDSFFLENIIGQFGKICVYIFLFISGYGLYISYLNKTVTILSICKRILKFYLNYWAVFGVFIGLGLITGNIQWNNKVIIENALGLKSTFNAEWWFIRVYIILLFLFPIFRSILKKVNIIACIMMSILLFGIGSILSIIGIFPLTSLIFYNQFFFFIGIVICKFNVFDKVNLYLQNKRLSVSFISIGLFTMMPFINFIMNSIPIIEYFNFIVLTPIFIWAISNIKFKSKVISLVGYHSTNIWLCHSFFCYYYFREFTYMPRWTPLIFIWLLTLSVLSSLIINKLVEFENSIFITLKSYKFSKALTSLGK